MIEEYHSTCVYGLQGTGKSTFIAGLIEELLKDCPEGSKARIATAEHAAAYNDLVSRNLAEVWRFNNRPHPFEVSRRMAEGYWPENVKDPTSRLIAPSPATFAKYPIRVFEGIGTTAGYITSNHIEGGLLQRAGKGDIIGPVQEHVQFMDNDEGIGGFCWTHFRIGQSEMMGLVQTTQKWPGYIIWSSHEDDGKDRGVPIVGPEVVGSKMTGVIGREFDDLWHLVGVAQEVQDNSGQTRALIERRLFLKEHVYPGGAVLCKSKNSATLAAQAKVPDYIRLSINGAPVLDAPSKLLGFIRA